MSPNLHQNCIKAASFKEALINHRFLRASGGCTRICNRTKFDLGICCFAAQNPKANKLACGKRFNQRFPKSTTPLQTMGWHSPSHESWPYARASSDTKSAT